MSLEKFENTVFLVEKGDQYDRYRKEYNDKLFSWNEIHDNACDTEGDDAELNAIEQVRQFTIERGGDNLDDTECLEDKVAMYCDMFEIMFDANGNITIHNNISIKKKKCVLKYPEMADDLCIPSEYMVDENFRGHQIGLPLFVVENTINGPIINKIMDSGKDLVYLQGLERNAEFFGLEKEEKYACGILTETVVYAPYVPEDHPSRKPTVVNMECFPNGATCDIELMFGQDNYCRYTVLRLDFPKGDKTPVVEAVYNFFAKEFDELTEEERKDHFPNDPNFITYDDDPQACTSATDWYDHIGNRIYRFCYSGLDFLDDLRSIRLIGVKAAA